LPESHHPRKRKESPKLASNFHAPKSVFANHVAQGRSAMTPLSIRAYRICLLFGFIPPFFFALFATFCSISLPSPYALNPPGLRRASNISPVNHRLT
jgi:hypothetical protein